MFILIPTIKLKFALCSSESHKKKLKLMNTVLRSTITLSKTLPEWQSSSRSSTFWSTVKYLLWAHHPDLYTLMRVITFIFPTLEGQLFRNYKEILFVVYRHWIPNRKQKFFSTMLFVHEHKHHEMQNRVRINNHDAHIR